MKENVSIYCKSIKMAKKSSSNIKVYLQNSPESISSFAWPHTSQLFLQDEFLEVELMVKDGRIKFLMGTAHWSCRMYRMFHVVTGDVQAWLVAWLSPA